MNALDKAIESAGGVGKLASAIDTTQNVVSNWRLRGQVPANRCASIESATGGAVTRYDLRPDVFGAPPANDDREQEPIPVRRSTAVTGKAAEADGDPVSLKDAA